MPKLGQRKKRKVKTALYLKAQQVKDLKAISEADDVAVSQLVREGIDMVIDRRKKRLDK